MMNASNSTENDSPQFDPENPYLVGGSRESWIERVRRLDKPVWILLLLFFVTAALGLPLVWYSKSFSMPVKVILTIVVSIYTLILFACFFALMAWCWGRIQSVL